MGRHFSVYIYNYDTYTQSEKVIDCSWIRCWSLLSQNHRTLPIRNLESHLELSSAPEVFFLRSSVPDS